MTTIDELVARLDRVESELALYRLAHDYCAGADHRDEGRWLSVWTTDAVWAAGDDPDHTFTGIDAITAAVRRQWETFPIMLHATSNHVVEIDGDHATGRCDAVVIVQLPDLQWIVGGGSYDDEYRRDPEHGWRIRRRAVVRPFDLAPLAPAIGPVLPDAED